MLRDRQQKRGAAKIKTPLRLDAFAPLREQKKDSLAKKGRRKENTHLRLWLPVGRQAYLFLCVNKKKDCLAKPRRRKEIQLQKDLDTCY